MRERRSKKIKKRSSIFFWSLLVIWLIIIFLFSAQPYQQQDIKPLIKEWIPQWVMDRIDPNLHFQYGEQVVNAKYAKEEGVIEFFIRKTAHFVIFAVLGILLSIVLSRKLKKVRAYLYAWCISLALAGLDEWHQSFVPERTSSLSDVGLDMLGATFGILLIMFIHGLLHFIRWLSKREMIGRGLGKRD